MKCKDLIENSKLSVDAKKALHNTIASMNEKNIKEVDKLFLREVDSIKADRALLKVDADEIKAVAAATGGEKHAAGKMLFERISWRRGAGKPAFDNYGRRINEMFIQKHLAPSIAKAWAKSIKFRGKDELRKLFVENPEAYRKDIDGLLEIIKGDLREVSGADEMIEGWKRALYNPIAPEQLKIYKTGKEKFIAKTRELVNNSDDEIDRFYEQLMFDKDNVASMGTPTKLKQSVDAWDLKFKDEDAWLKWNKEFADDNFGGAFQTTWERIGKQAGLVKLTGSSNPKGYLRKLNEEVRKVEGESKWYTKNDKMISEITGEYSGWDTSMGPVAGKFGHGLQTFVDIENRLSITSKLEFTALTISSTQASTHSMWQSANFLSSKAFSRINYVGRAWYEMYKRGGYKATKENMHALGMMDLASQGAAVAKFSTEGGLDKAQAFGTGRLLSKAERGFFTGNLLEFFGTVEHATYPLRNAEFFFADIGKGWKNLDDYSKEAYTSLGFNEKSFDTIKPEMFVTEGMPVPVMDIRKVDRNIYDMYHGLVRTEADILGGNPSTHVTSGAAVPLRKGKKGTQERMVFNSMMNLKNFVVGQYANSVTPYAKQIRGMAMSGDKALHAKAALRTSVIGVPYGIIQGFSSRWIRYMAVSGGGYIGFQEWIEQDAYSEKSSIAIGAQMSFMADFIAAMYREFKSDDPNFATPFVETAGAIGLPSAWDMADSLLQIPSEMFSEDGEPLTAAKLAAMKHVPDIVAFQLLIAESYDNTIKEMKKELEDGEGIGDFIKSLTF